MISIAAGWDLKGCMLVGEQVAWQGLLDESGGGSVMDDTGAGKASIAAAVLTSRRLLLVSATLRPLCTFSPSPSDAPITSFLWLGPALLFCNSAHQVDPVLSAWNRAADQGLMRKQWKGAGLAVVFVYGSLCVHMSLAYLQLISMQLARILRKD